MRKERWDRKLRRKQLDRVFAAWRTVGHSGRPRSGWIRQIREAFGMSTRQLAAQSSMGSFELRDVFVNGMAANSSFG